MAKYFVKACPNCVFRKKMPGGGFLCAKKPAGDMDGWLEKHGRTPQRDWTPKMDMPCYSPDAQSRARDKQKERLSGFSSELGTLLSNATHDDK